MPHSIDTETEPDTGLACLALVARFHGLPANPEQIAHQSGKPGEPFSSDDILRAARRLGLKSRAIQSNWQRLAKTALPAIARHNDGHYFIIAGYEGETERLLIQDPLESRPLTLPREIFEAAWCGELILITKRSLLPGQGSRLISAGSSPPSLNTAGC